MIEILLLLATVGYALSSASYLAWVVHHRAPFRRTALVAGAAAGAALAGAAGLDLTLAAAPHLPTAARVLVLLALGASGVFFVGRLWRDLPFVGPAILPVATAISFAAYVKALSFGAAPVASGPLGALTVVHIGATMLGVLLFVPAYVLSVLFLSQEYRLKTKQLKGTRLPSLLSLEQSAWRLMYYGFPLYSVGILLGVIWADSTGPGAPLGVALAPQHVLAALSWCVYAFAIYRRVTTGWRGRRAALSLMAAFVTTLGAVLLYAMR